MRSLEIQIQSMVYFFLSGMFYGLSYNFHNRLFYYLKNQILRFFIDVCFNLFLGFLFFLILFKINYGFINLYLFLFFCSGFLFYYNFFSLYILTFIELMVKFGYYLLRPLFIVFFKILCIIKSTMVKLRRLFTYGQKEETKI